MAFTYNFGSNPSIDYPRFLVADTDSTHPVFDDREITMAAQIDNVQFMASSSSSGGQILSTTGTPGWHRIAAVLLDALAANKARLAAALEVLDIKIDPSKAADMLMKLAASYREIESQGGFFAIAETVYDQFTWRERVWKQWLRQFGG